MNLPAFKASLKDNQPPASLSPLLKAMWYDGRDEWDKAHDIADGHPALAAKRVHAYLHRKEGDLWNADYWYRNAGLSRPAISLEEEWEILVEELLLELAK